MKANYTLITATIASLLWGCSSNPPSYSLVKSYEIFKTPGAYVSPPRTDLVLGWDNSGSMAPYHAEQFSLFQQFLSDLDQQLLYYRFIMVPLVPFESAQYVPGNSIDSNIAQIKNATATLFSNQVANHTFKIAANHFDSNWGSDWVKEELTSDGLDRVDPEFFVKPSQYSTDFIETNTSLGSIEPGLLMVSQYLKQAQVRQEFLRSDAVLATIIVSNGDDTSQPYTTTTPPATVDPVIMNEYRNLKANDPNMARLFSIVNTGSVPGTCLGSNVKARRYMFAAENMISGLTGNSYSLCDGSNAFKNALNKIKESLVTTSATYTQSYLFLPREPKPETIRVFKVTGSTKEELTKDESGLNGWKYLGLGTHPIVTAPVVGPSQTGYAIELYGAAQVIGNNEHAEVEYDPITPM